MPLSSEELEFAQEVINDTMPGNYTIKEMFGAEFYEFILDPTKHGVRFKQSVDAGQLSNIQAHEELSHVWHYIIKGG